MPTAPHTAAEYWDRYLPAHDPNAPAPQPEFEWTQYGGHGPGAELLGAPRRALDLGPAQGKEAVFLARQGVKVTGVDLSHVQVERARSWWNAEPNVHFVQADACDFLRRDESVYDAVYSVWGALWFTDPDELLPLIFGRLDRGGVLAFSQAMPAASVYGPQAMGGKHLEQAELTVLRWQYPPHTWADLLKRHGFTQVEAYVLDAPDDGKAGTLMVSAVRA
ncbi:class I SAM-dependent methyltransferase [Streptomyces sp. NBC_01381]|uniref:class I SAM-dependent methyltransferase n=1 Tax=Streptomyces sp. NBC_01381 TaxID=2903845 RepID=UPI0022581A4A|nr:class I SAM-dependent methyltransferase [Streptomyces sp. NBC_01381]MCX4673678.1 class I SAM-dependent methyltransferase [Streptomyces sp. NBC_01381]